MTWRTQLNQVLRAILPIEPKMKILLPSACVLYNCLQVIYDINWLILIRKKGIFEKRTKFNGILRKEKLCTMK